MNEVSAAVAAKTVPLVEAFGPTIQGEGALAGLPTLFLRLGLCDYRCVWCDSKFAVEPETVKRDARRVLTTELVPELEALGRWDDLWVTLSGGNPAMYELGDFTAEAQEAGYLVAVETQGSLWRDWLSRVDHLTVSPKPPSSGMVDDRHTRQTARFLDRAELMSYFARSLKIVVFDETDFSWARDLIHSRPEWQAFLSVGTNSVTRWSSEVVELPSDRQVRDQVGERYRWLCDQVASDRLLAGVRVLPQLHVIAYGHLKGV